MTRELTRTEKPKNDVTADALEGWTRSVGAFTRMIDRLQDDYAKLEKRHEALNRELVSVNESLRVVAESNRRLALYLDQILAGVTVGIIAVDRDGIVRLFNPAAARMLNLPADQVINRPYDRVWPERCDDPATALACARGAAPANNRRREYPNGDGAPLVVSVSTVRLESENGGDNGNGTETPDTTSLPEQRSGCPVPDPVSTGDMGGAIEIFSDLTPLETMSRELARLKTLAALGEMSATIAHEIRNPLGGIIGFADLLARRGADNAEHREMVTKIRRGAENVNRIVERLLEFAREPKVEKRPLDWEPFFRTTLDQFEEGVKRRGVRLTLVRKWPEHMPAGRADGICLRQALWNILENAEHATGARGRVTFSADLHDDGRLFLSVSDNGDGIDPKVADRVFSPFVTTKKTGTGLGLATARKLIEAHGGTISIESRQGEGTIVRVELPSTVAGGE